VVSDELKNRMIKSRNHEVEMWKENVRRKPARRIKPNSSMLIEKYIRQQQQHRCDTPSVTVADTMSPQYSYHVYTVI
jgi:hypothetical protein